MLFAQFTTQQEANDFIKTVDPVELQYHEGAFVIFYNPILTVEEAKAKRVTEQRYKAETQLALQEMDITLLETVLAAHKASGDKEQIAATEKQMKQTLSSIDAWKAQLAAVELWEKV